MRTVVIAGLTAGYLTILAGCGPQTLLVRPDSWPERWSDRSLYHTPNAYIYASSAAAAGEADRFVIERVQQFQTRSGRPAAKGLVVVTDSNDDLFTPNIDSLLTIAAKGALGPHSEDELADQFIRSKLAEFRDVTASVGVDPSLVCRVAALPLCPVEMARLVELPADQAEELGWALAVPTKACLRDTLREAASAYMKEWSGVGPVAQIALAPLRPWAEALAAQKAMEEWQEMFDRQLCLADSELAESVDLSLGSPADEGVIVGDTTPPLQSGDRVLKIEGKSIFTPGDFLSAYIAELQSGDAFQMVVLRDGSELTLTMPPLSAH